MPKRSWREFDQPSSKMMKIDSASKNQLNVDRKPKVQKTKSGKRGKTVTVISELCIDLVHLKTLLKDLKSYCSTGGTIKGDSIELQGDQVDIVLVALIKKGYNAKKAGG